MSSQVSSRGSTEGSARSGRATGASGDLTLYLVIGLLVLGTWHFSTRGYFKAGDDFGYWLGVAGGVLMLLLFGYPLRKYVPGMRHWGGVKWWFLAHMTLGIGGPLLILAHTTFRVGSLNAAVALYSMVVVSLSGVVGRFLYVRVHRGLHGKRSTLSELKSRAGFEQATTRSRLHFAPEVEASLMAFQQIALIEDRSWRHDLQQLLVLPCREWLVYRRCCKLLDASFAAKAVGRSADEVAKRRRQARKLVRRYLASVVKVAQFSVYERVFALWHVAHVPFVYLLVVSSVVHVVAVHAY